MKTLRKIRAVCGMGLALLAGPAGAQFNLLHEFAGGGSEGSYPYGSVTLSGSTLYGMTRSGGDSDLGTVFKMNTDGTGYTNLHEFAGGASDGGNPRGSLTLSGNTLYGLTQFGGDGVGVLFKMDADGTGYTNLHVFGSGTDGFWPYGSLLLSGNTLYGTAFNGGSNGWGVVFKINTDGGGYQLVHEFAGTDGGYLVGSLALSDSTLYGMTYLGGNWGEGTVFKMNTNGTGFTTLREFSGAGGTSDGGFPWGSLTLAGDTLYGMTYAGGTNDVGVVFKMNTAGGDFALLHEFIGGTTDGSYPYGDLTLSDSALYGMTSEGGGSGFGTVFQIQTNGTGYSLLHEFAGGGNDGRNPFGSLTLSGSTLYGMTRDGGDSNLGTVFSFAVPEPSTAALLGAGLAGLLMRRRKS